jgi:hypothetical protein
VKTTWIAVGSVPKFVPVTVNDFFGSGGFGLSPVFASRVGADGAMSAEVAWFLASADTKTMPKKGGLTIPATNPSVAAVPLGTPRFSAIARPIKKPNMLNLMFVSILVLDLLLA